MSEPYERLDRAMEERRLALRMSWAQLARSADISPQALRSMRRGEYRPSRLTARALDEALEWELGSVEAILAGGEPVLERGQVVKPSPLGELIEGARRRTDLGSLAEAEEAAIVDDWLRLLLVKEPEGRDAAALARMAHVVGLAPSAVEEIGELDVARRIRKLREGEGTAKVIRPRTAYRDESAEDPEFEEGSIRLRVEELIRRRKLRQLDRALSLVEDLDDDGHRDAG